MQPISDHFESDISIEGTEDGVRLESRDPKIGGHRLSEHNDGLDRRPYGDKVEKKSFEEIADLIEKYL